MDHNIARTRRHVKTTPIKAKEYLRNEVLKDTMQRADRFHELLDHYTNLYEHEEPKYLIPSVITM